MKFFHLSDLHFGKQLHGYDLTEEQRKCVRDMIDAAAKELPDAVVIAGDIYDRSVPSGSAMTLLEELFAGLDGISQKRKPIEILVIAGNHDSPQRLQYGSTFLKRHHIHIAVFPPQEENGRMQKVTLQDEYGAVHFYLLPYTRPGMLRHMMPERDAVTAQDAVRYLLGREEIDWEERNVFVSHQFYMSQGKSPQSCDSESPCLSVGGLDSVDAALVEKFDYVALGHLHSPQKVGEGMVRYCGTPYPYSVSEAGQDKSVTVVELGKKGEVSIRLLPFLQERNVIRVRGTLKEVTQRCGDGICHDYASIVLTDEEALDAPKDYLEHYYDHILEIQVDNSRMRRIQKEEMSDVRELTPGEAFAGFFHDIAGRPMEEQEARAFEMILKEVAEV